MVALLAAASLTVVPAASATTSAPPPSGATPPPRDAPPASSDAALAPRDAPPPPLAPLGAATTPLVPLDTPAQVAADAVPRRPAPELTGSRPVAPGLALEHYRFRGTDGGVDIEVLRFAADDPRLEFRPELGGGQMAGLEATHQATRRLGESAVAAINGSFFRWTARPVGEPRGLMVRDGEYLSEPELGWGGSWRGAFGITGEGNLVFGNPGASGQMVLQGPCGRSEGPCTLPVGGVNRLPRQVSPSTPHHREATLLTPPFGASTGTPPGTVEVVLPDYDLQVAGEHRGAVASISTAGDTAIPPGGAVLAATGSIGTELLAQLEPGSEVTVRLAMPRAWRDVVQALGGGPTILREGRRTTPSHWRKEGFDPSGHSAARHPRTIVGRGVGNELLLVTVDGRTERSGGLDLADTQDVLLHLGATHAVHLDGGGSSTMVVDDRIVNDPCCDAAGYRRVATNLVVHSDVRTPDVRRIGAWDPYTTARKLAVAGWQEGADTVVLANGADFRDALASGSLARHLDAPLLLTLPNRVPSTTLAALERLRPATVVVTGGPQAVAPAVPGQLVAAGYRVRRLGGSDWFTTAARIARTVGAPQGTAYLTSAKAWRPGISAAAAAAADDAPLVLTPRDRLHPAAVAALRSLDVDEVVVVGTPKVVAEPVEAALRRAGFATRRVGATGRYGTTARLLAATGEDSDVGSVMVASGARPQDGLVAGPYAARQGIPLTLADPVTLRRSNAVLGWIRRQPLDAATVIGNRSVVATYVAWELQQLVDR